MQIDNYTFEEEQQIVKSATRRKELKRLDQIIKEKHFRIRSNSIQNYFMRMSFAHKKEFLIRLMENITGLPSMLQLLHMMSLEHTKMIIYTQVDPETNFVYDKLILDHDRMLDEKVLSETMDSDIAWFGTLEDGFQVSLATDLIRMSSGFVKKKLYLPIFRIYHKMLAEHRKFQWKMLTSDESSFYQSGALINNISQDEDDYDPKHPATIEVMKQRNKWDEMISKYRSEVRMACEIYSPSLPKVETSEKRDEKTKKDKKSKNKDATVTTKTKSDNAKKTTDGKGAKSGGIDMIQLLPIWVVKKIFGYLDQKTLLSIKNYNHYYSYVIQDILKERKARENINKYLENLESQIDPEKLKCTKLSSDKPPRKAAKRPHGIYYEMGAISKKLVPKQKNNLVDTCLISEAAKESADEFALPTGELVSFPRLIEQDIHLYRHLPCFLQDINVIYDVEGDIERQRSFLTYSLSSVVSTLKISVNEQDLSDW